MFEIFPQLEEKSIPQLGEIMMPLHSVSTDTKTFPLNIFAIPWGHHKVLIDNFENAPQKVLFYAAKTLQNGWSRAVLENMIGDKGKNNGLYERQGNAVNNFPDTLIENVNTKSGQNGHLVICHFRFGKHFFCLL